jgi:hypothetical protein
MSCLYPCLALAPWGLYPMLSNLYVVYPIPKHRMSRHPIMQKRQMQRLLVLTVQADRRAVISFIALPKDIV